MNPILQIRDLKKTYLLTSGVFRKSAGSITAVDGVNLEIYPNETLGLVGESGCGKTTLSKLILGLEEADDGNILFDDVSIRGAKAEALSKIRKGIQVVFQDPFGSLNPRRRVQAIIEEPMIIHKQGTRADRQARTLDLIRMVGLNEDMLSRYPHEFSGGQRQRICIARALAVNPRLLICDEPVSALDVSIQAQVINLLVDLQKELRLSYLFISHNLSVVGYLSHRIAVMYKGRIVELAGADSLFANPLHPYTRCLMEAVPEPKPNASRSYKYVKKNDVVGLGPVSACACSAWCEAASGLCREESPVLMEKEPGHFVACHSSD